MLMERDAARMLRTTRPLTVSQGGNHMHNAARHESSTTTAHTVFDATPTHEWAHPAPVREATTLTRWIDEKGSVVRLISSLEHPIERTLGA